MRGIVMILMVVDHASLAYNADRFALDSAANWVPGTAIPTVEFTIRWLTHLCAPTFVFLAGTAMAIMVERRLAKGMDPRQVDRDILIRGAIILLVDPILISAGLGKFTFQVMYAIGAAMILMAFLRKLPSAALVALALGWMVFGELVTDLVWNPPEEAATVAAALTMAWYRTDVLSISYPVLPWLAMMMLGWVYGRHILDSRDGKARIAPAALLAWWGIVAVVVFLVVRGINDYGNMFLYRDGPGLLQWLHVSKYPPSLSFTSLELGVLFLVLSALMVLEPRVTARRNGVLLVFGQTAFFFYVIHRVFFDATANWFSLKRAGDLPMTLLASLAMLIALYPCCRWYRTYKSAHPDSVLRFF